MSPIQLDGAEVDLSRRVKHSEAIVASPTDNTETIIATFTIADSFPVMAGVQLFGFAAFTVGTNGTACNLRIRQTNAAGSVVSATGAVTAGIAATKLAEMDVQGFDAAIALPNQVYVLTLTVTAGSAASTVSAVQLLGLVV
jgi:hypothetical protein